MLSDAGHLRNQIEAEISHDESFAHLGQGDHHYCDTILRLCN
jgi:hypothetical protein